MNIIFELLHWQNRHHRYFVGGITEVGQHIPVDIGIRLASDEWLKWNYRSVEFYWPITLNQDRMDSSPQRVCCARRRTAGERDMHVNRGKGDHP